MDAAVKSKEQDAFHLEIDLNVLNHLGIGLYSSTPAVVTEIVANAWDADAKLVNVEILDDQIIVHDDGHGMGAAELQARFLRVGYARRDQPKGSKSDTLGRPVMGRKGIGKLAMFSLADQIDIWTKMEGKDPISARINVEQLKRDIKSDRSYTLEPLDTPYDWNGSTGTRIVLSKLTSGTDKTESFLRPRIARRFSVLGDIYNFKVSIGGSEITTQDRGYHADIQFWWDLDDATRDSQKPLLKNLATDESGHECIKRVNQVVVVHPHAYTLRGFIATVAKPKSLKKTEDNINQISLFANGRVFQEDMLKDIGNAKIFNSYIVGEIHADFLDADSIDRATANREAVKTGDPLVSAVRNWLVNTLDEIADQWDEWRRQQNVDSDDSRTQLALETWYDSLADARDRKLAKRLINPILSAEHSNDETKNKEIKRDLVRSAIIGFEKLRVRKQLDKLEKVTDVMSVEFQRLFLSLDNVEATHYHEITRSRLQVIEKFEKEIADTDALEKVAQEYLFDHLWLLDPTWGPVGESKVMEQTLTKELYTVVPDATSGARIDIAYRTSSGRHVIVELKKPDKRSIDVDDLMKQGKKYKAAAAEYLRLHPDIGGLNGRIPPIDVVFVTSEVPRTTYGDALEDLRKNDMQSFTYKGMIVNARRAYQEYLNASPKVSIIEDVISNII
ncbi:BbrUII/HgiDII family restriction enzyme [Pseudomonas ogarae]|uniref:HSP90 family protein n=1 Tax=Pseudomonas ogarae (strain DSM 112162 / CECT 30235 / F113) TaxID=1114970 RepID=A0ABM6R3P7_PSEO1|nr:ATP-binding protein [Pseudomonas ogarae]AEV64276.1 dna mismatch repair protein [Pseudomonas ogarae]AUO48106.1 HSP90 family protein [Pseudomonas ogarae]